MSKEIKGRNSARMVKAASSILAIGSILGACWTANLDSAFWARSFGVVFLLSISAFVVGRFME